MYTNDLISDTLARIRNAILRSKSSVETPASNVVKSILQIMQDEGFISAYEAQADGVKRKFVVSLRYVDGTPAIRELKRLSKPGIRRYVGYRQMPKVKSGQGIAIVTTPKGIMTTDKARQLQVGGELLCEIW
jgi:small subunit ribosomal protein S8